VRLLISVTDAVEAADDADVAREAVASY